MFIILMIVAIVTANIAQAVHVSKKNSWLVIIRE